MFEKVSQPHSCHTVSLADHFKNKAKAKELFEYLLNHINRKVGACRVISLPCCVHLFGTYDFLAALPKKDRLEIRFALERVIESTRVKQSVPISSKKTKYCIDIRDEKDIDTELIAWIREAYQ